MATQHLESPCVIPEHKRAKRILPQGLLGVLQREGIASLFIIYTDDRRVSIQ